MRLRSDTEPKTSVQLTRDIATGCSEYFLFNFPDLLFFSFVSVAERRNVFLPFKTWFVFYCEYSSDLGIGLYVLKHISFVNIN